MSQRAGLFAVSLIELNLCTKVPNKEGNKNYSGAEKNDESFLFFNNWASSLPYLLVNGKLN